MVWARIEKRSRTCGQDSDACDGDVGAGEKTKEDMVGQHQERHVGENCQGRKHKTGINGADS